MSRSKLLTLVLGLASLLVLLCGMMIVRIGQGSTQGHGSSSNPALEVVRPRVLGKPLASSAVTTSPKLSVRTTAPVGFAGFRGLKWGARLSAVPGMVPINSVSNDVDVQLEDFRFVDIKDIHTKKYSRVGDKLEFGTAKVGSIVYETFDDQFYRASINKFDPIELSTAFRAFFSDHGFTETDVASEGRWSWDNKAVDPAHSVTVNVVVFDDCYATITYDALATRLLAAQREEGKKALQTAAEKAKRDF